MTSRSLRILIATSAAAALLASSPAALAYPDAKIDTQIKPDFGLLLRPPLKPKHRPHKPRWRRYNGGYGSGYYPPYPDDYLPPAYGQQVVTVDCAAPLAPAPYGADAYAPPPASDGYSDPPPADGDAGYASDSYGDAYAPTGAISEGVRQVAAGGTVFVKNASACKETIVVDKSVVIAGEPGSAFDDAPARRPRLTPPPAAPCIRVLPGSGEVEIRDLEIEAPRGGAASCVESWDSSVALVRTKISYTGDGSAVYAAGGRLIIRQSTLEGRTYDAVVVADGADFEIFRARIRGEAAGLDVTAGMHGGLIEKSKIHADAQTQGGVGVLIRGLRSGSGRIALKNVLLRGWRTGVHLERGAAADITRSRFLAGAHGVIADNADLLVQESAIGADQVGVYVGGGKARIYSNRIFGVRRRGIFVEYGAEVDRRNNWIQREGDWRNCEPYAGDYCYDFTPYSGLLRDEGRDDIYAFGWDGDGYEAGFQRDGAPGPYTPPPPPRKRGWRWR